MTLVLPIRTLSNSHSSRYPPRHIRPSLRTVPPIVHVSVLIVLLPGFVSPRLSLFFFFFFGWGKGGKCVMHLSARAPYMGLRDGLPMGLSTRWTFCRTDLTH